MDPVTLRGRVATALAATAPRASYRQLPSDTWAESQEPIVPGELPDEATMRHLAYHVDVREVTCDEVINPATYTGRTRVSVAALCCVRPIGDRAIGASQDQALQAARHLWQVMRGLDRSIPDITTVPDGTTYSWAPLSSAWVLIQASILVLFTDSVLEA